MITDDVAWMLADVPRILGKCSRGLTVCELGNQWSGWRLSAPVKLILNWLGYEHTSIDQNGLDGALQLDLSQPLPAWMNGRFDLVTNAGTTEHVNVTMDHADQWQAYKSIHDLAKPEAAMLHVIPDERGQHTNCRYVYSHTFINSLSKLCGYEVVYFYDSRSDANHMATLLLKRSSSRFPALQEFRHNLAREIIIL